MTEEARSKTKQEKKIFKYKNAKVTQEVTPDGISQLTEPINNLKHEVSDWENEFNERFVITNPRNEEDEGWLTGVLPLEVKQFIRNLLEGKHGKE